MFNCYIVLWQVLTITAFPFTKRSKLADNQIYIVEISYENLLNSEGNSNKKKNHTHTHLAQILSCFLCFNFARCRAASLSFNPFLSRAKLQCLQFEIRGDTIRM